MGQPSVIFICSAGPMGSTLAGAMIEKLGVLNLPLRKTGLSEYLTGQLSPDATTFQRNIRKAIIAQSGPGFRGGVGVADRDLPDNYLSLTDYSRVRDELSVFNNQEFDSISKLFVEGRKLYAKSVTYKKVDLSSEVHIEYPVDFHRYSWGELKSGMDSSFLNYTLVKMRRPFREWLNSSISQVFHASPLRAGRSIARFSINRRADEYDAYNRAMDQFPGDDWAFDELFQEGIEERISALGKDFGLQPIPRGCIFDLNNDNLLFDLYGKLTPAHRALRKFDDHVNFIPENLQSALDNFHKGRDSKPTYWRFMFELSAKVRVFLSFISYVMHGHYPIHRIYPRTFRTWRQRSST